MGEQIVLSFFVDLREIDICLGKKLTPTNQIEFGHQILSFLNSTSLNQTNRIRIHLNTKSHIIDVSPMLSVPPCVNEFVSLLHECLLKSEIRVGGVKVMWVRKNPLPIPENSYVLSPYSNKTSNPETIVSKSADFVLSLNPSDANEVCFSHYPLSVLNQSALIVSAYESSLNLF